MVLQSKKKDFISSPEVMLDVILDNICEQLQLDNSRREMAEKAYKTVTDWIEADEDFFKKLNPYLYAYGSYAIGTTVKPLGKEEFDLDFTAMVIYNWSKLTPQQFLDKLFDRLNSHGTYKGKVERLRYCVRINYASKFHLDIMPGCLIPETENRMVVPDTRRTRWVLRNPKGYINWFEGLYIQKVEQLNLFDYYQFRGMSVELKSEPLPQTVHYKLTQPIQRAIQLLKRYRDIYFEDKKELATSSVILTTIAGRYYQGETSIYETLNGIITRIYYNSQRLKYGDFLEVTNPADDHLPSNQQEKFSEKWKEKPELYKAFLEFVADVKIKWEKLKEQSGSVRTKSNLIEELFGQKVSQNAFTNHSLLVNRFRSDGTLGITSSGTIISNREKYNEKSTPVVKNTFDGEKK